MFKKHLVFSVVSLAFMVAGCSGGGVPATPQQQSQQQQSPQQSEMLTDSASAANARCGAAPIPHHPEEGYGWPYTVGQQKIVPENGYQIAFAGVGYDSRLGLETTCLNILNSNGTVLSQEDVDATGNQIRKTLYFTWWGLTGGHYPDFNFWSFGRQQEDCRYIHDRIQDSDLYDVAYALLRNMTAKFGPAPAWNDQALDWMAKDVCSVGKADTTW